MGTSSSVDRSCGFVITDAGRQGWREPEVCACRPELEGALLVCNKCGTVFAVLKAVSWSPPMCKRD